MTDAAFRALGEASKALRGSLETLSEDEKEYVLEALCEEMGEILNSLDDGDPDASPWEDEEY